DGRVARELEAHELAVGTDDVLRIDVGEVVAGAAADVVTLPVPRGRDAVVAAARVDRVGLCGADDPVSPLGSTEHGAACGSGDQAEADQPCGEGSSHRSNAPPVIRRTPENRLSVGREGPQKGQTKEEGS